jgi:hypothetical protein
VVGVSTLPLLLAAALVGCSNGHGQPASSSAAIAPPAGGAPTPTTEPRPSASGSSGYDASGSVGAAGGGDTAGATGSGQGGTATGGAAGSASPGGNGGATGGSPTEAPAGPNLDASPVFEGEPCEANTDTAPQTAINGLMLYCNPAASPSQPGSWADSPPTPSPTGPAQGTRCTSADVGQVEVDPAGRPVSCLRQPDGDLQWADIS